MGTFLDYIPVTGNVEPRETVYLDAVDGGQVSEVLAEEGAIVTKGQPLLRLSNTNLQLQVLNSEAQLSEQLNWLTSTRLQFEQTRLSHARELIDIHHRIEQMELRLHRVRQLEGDGAISRSDIEDTELELRRLQHLESEIERARAMDEALQGEQMRQLDRTVSGLTRNLTLARESLDNLIIKAPLSGQLTTLDAHLGQSKRPGERLGQVDQIDAFKVVAYVDEHYVSRVRVGQTATTQIDGNTHRLKLLKVYPEVRDREFKVDLAFTNTVPASVRRGQTLQLRLEIGSAGKSLIVANGPFYERNSPVVSSSASRWHAPWWVIRS